MPRATPRWTVLAAIAGAGVILMMVIDFIVRRPGLFIALVLLVYLFSRPHLPWCYTNDEIDRYHNTFARALVRVWLPIAGWCGLIAGTAYGVLHGVTGTLLLAMLVAYIGDRVIAWSIRRTVGWWQARHRLVVSVPATTAAPGQGGKR